MDPKFLRNQRYCKKHNKKQNDIILQVLKNQLNLNKMNIYLHL